MTSKLKPVIKSSASWIEPHRCAFLRQLEVQGYSVGALNCYRRTVNCFCREFENRGPAKTRLKGTVLEEIEQAVLNNTPKRIQTATRHHLSRFVAHLVDAGAASLQKPVPEKPDERGAFRAEYTAYLRQQRGLSKATIDHCLYVSERFLTFRFGEAVGDLNAIGPDEIVSFLLKLHTGKKPYRCKSLSSLLRNLFQFLFWSGKIQRNLTDSIPRIAQPQPVNLPRFLKPWEVQRLIDSVERRDAMGRRNYAMLLLQARLGLRAIEVIAIRLEDIDWRAGSLLIRGKGKLHDRMPLPVDVGEAIVDYIQNGRAGTSRTLFVSAKAPYQRFKGAQIINEVLHTAFVKTGLKPPQRYAGSHVLRHSLATGLLGKGASLEEISNVMRHRSRATTMIYAKCDTGALRSLAQAWPAEGGVP
jgi:integrase/recombinase XerD